MVIFPEQGMRATTSMTLTLAVDAMGGDDAPGIVISGLAIAAEKHPNLHFLVFGREDLLNPLFDQHPLLSGRYTLTNCDVVITGDDKPANALRGGMRDSSMRRAIEAVKQGEAQAIISAGNTGALMALAKVLLRMVPGVDRPAIASPLPTAKGQSVVLDLGANVQCDERNLLQFGIMGALYARFLFGKDRPTIGLLNIGSEEQKGHEVLQVAADLMRDSKSLPGEFHGFIEADDIAAGTTDVVVTDGFTGNVALKTTEGVGRLISGMVREAFQSGIFSRIGYLFAMPAMARLRQRLDPRTYNGGMFVGLGGICVKSHGGTDDIGFANAVSVSVELMAGDFQSKIAQAIADAGDSFGLDTDAD